MVFKTSIYQFVRKFSIDIPLNLTSNNLFSPCVPMISSSTLAFPTLRIRSPSLPSSSSSSSSSRPSRRLLWPRCATTAVPPPAAAATLYDVLGIPASATVGEIKAAYRRLARVCHPDVAAASRAAPADEFIRVHAAYATLTDPEKRVEYDRRVMAAAASSMASATVGRRPPGPFYSSSPRRMWETDQCW